MLRNWFLKTLFLFEAQMRKKYAMVASVKWDIL
jgi:hypothetical protein